MPESAESAPEDQLLDDCKSSKSLLQDKFKFAKGDIINAFRIGSKSNDKDRPFLIKFATEQIKYDILKESKDMKLLKGNISYPVYFSLDRTALQRKERQCLLDELRTRKNNGESDLIIKNDKIFNKSEIFFDHKPRLLSICCFNARSIVNKLNTLHAFLTCNIDFIFVTETWRSTNFLDSMICHRDYNVLRDDRR